MWLSYRLAESGRRWMSDDAAAFLSCGFLDRLMHMISFRTPSSIFRCLV